MGYIAVPPLVPQQVNPTKHFHPWLGVYGALQVLPQVKKTVQLVFCFLIRLWGNIILTAAFFLPLCGATSFRSICVRRLVL